MAMSPKKGLGIRGWGLAGPRRAAARLLSNRANAGKLRTSVVRSTRRYRRFSARTRASLRSATLTRPCTRGGAIRSNQRDKLVMRSRRPRPSVTTTSRACAAAVRERFIRLDDLLHELVAHHVPVVEVDKRDTFDRTHHLHRLHQTGGA